MRKEVRITVRTNPRLTVQKSVISILTITGLIGLGIIADSAAMQWAGFVLAFLTLFAVGAVRVARREGISITEARKILDELEAEEIAA